VAKRRSEREVRSNAPLWAGCVAAIVATAVAGGARMGGLGGELENLERRTLDLRFTLRGPRPAGPETVIVAYDDKTYAEDPTLFGRRAGWAKLLDGLAAAKARAVGVDAFFADAEQVLPPDLTGEIGRHLDAARVPAAKDADALLERVRSETEGDARLAEALKRAGNVVLGVHMGLNGGTAPEEASLSRAKYGQSVPGRFVPKPIREVIASLPLFNRAAKALGFMTVHEDDTQTVRVSPMVRALGDSVVAPLSVQLVAQALGVGRGGIAYLGDDHALRIGERVVPLGDDDGIWLNFRGSAGTFPTHSVIDVVNGRLAPGALDGKIVLVGFTHLGRDRTRSPFGPGQPGVEVHATAIDNLLRGDWLRRAPLVVDLGAALGLGLLVSLLFWNRLRLPVYAQGAGTLLWVGAYLFATHVLFARRGLWVAWIGPGLTAMLAGAVCLTVAYAREAIQRRRLRFAFGHYLAEGVIEELLRNPGALALGGERRDLSVLFSDIRGFTSFSEKLAPEQLVKVLNTYLTPMTRAVLGSGGFLDKFIGDAVMAVFGAPVPEARHPAQALACALRMHAALAEIAPSLKTLGVEIEIGVGINSGEMAVGNMGSDEHFNYTVMGDAVNLASRLEALTKTYGVFCLVGATTRAAAPPELEFREIDLVRVKGKARPVAIFELCAGPERRIVTYVEPARFDAALVAYREGRFPAARDAFGAFAALNPADAVAALYLERLRGLPAEAPAGWDGVTVHTSK
jgi:adenylate cyclase